jgi:hypothetical protein
MNILNYKRKKNIYNRHYYINTHAVGRGCAQTQAPLGGGPAITNGALCEDLSARWHWGLSRALNQPQCQVALGRSKRQVALGFSLAGRGVLAAIANWVLRRPKR